jgi:outer membrane protein assembly factor BamB
VVLLLVVGTALAGSVITNVSGARVRSAPAAHGPVVVSLPVGTVLTEKGERGEWLRVKGPDGAGFVHGSLVSPWTEPQAAAIHQQIGSDRLGLQELTEPELLDLVAFLDRVSRVGTRAEQARLRLLHLDAVARAAHLDGAPQALVVDDYAQGRRISQDAYWKLAEEFADTAVAENIAWGALRVGSGGECEGDPLCMLQRAHRHGEGRYLAAHPHGSHAELAHDQLGHELDAVAESGERSDAIREAAEALRVSVLATGNQATLRRIARIARPHVDASRAPWKPERGGAGFSADPGRRGVSSGVLPSALEVLWTADVGIVGYHGSPVLAGQTLLVPSQGSTWNACDDRDGVVRLRLDGSRTGFVAAGCDVNGLTVVNGAVVFVTDEAEVVWTDMGDVRWTRRLLGRLYAPPIQTAGGLLVSGQGGATLLDPLTGEERTHIRIPIDVRNHSVVGELILLSCTDNITRAYHVDGTPLWEYDHRGDAGPGYAAAAAVPGEAYVAGAYDGSSGQGQYARLNTLTGDKVWGVSFGRGAKASPAISDDLILVADSGRFQTSTPGALQGWETGSLHALDRKTGEERWSTREERGGSWASPVVVGDGVVWVTMRGDVLILDLASGSIRSELSLGEAVYATPVVGDGVVYVATAGGGLFALGVR